MSRSPVLDRAQALAELGRWADALALLGPHVASDPDDAHAWSLIAQCQLGAGEPIAAQQAAQTAIKLNPDSEWPHRLMSIAWTRMREYSRARQAAHIAVQLSPSLWLTHRQVADIDVVSDLVDDSTWAAAQRAVELAPNEAEAHNMLGRVALADKKYRQAAAAFREALRLDPSNVAARNNLAVVHLRWRRLPSAARHFMGVLRLSPNSALAAANLRVVLRAWAAVLDLVAAAGCLVALNATSGHSITGPATTTGPTEVTLPPAMLPSGGVLLPSGFSNNPSGVVIQLPAGSVPPAQIHIAATGRPAILTIVAAIELALLLLVVLSLRRSLGPRMGRILRASLRVDRHLLIMVTTCLVVIALLTTAAALGLPAARGITALALAVSIIAAITTGRFRRRTRRRY